MTSTKPRNLVVCLDGTGNQIEENLSNVLKLYRALKKSDEQIVFYDQGVGTLGHRYTWGALMQKIRNGLGLAFGLGLDANVIKAYEFIVRNHQQHKVAGSSRDKGDNIFIFGFSRGSHTARVLAGLIYEIGILKPDQIHLCGAALTAYKQSKRLKTERERALKKQANEGLTEAYLIDQDIIEDDLIDDNFTEEERDKAKDTKEKKYEGEGANFRRVAATKLGIINFLGVWDTVSSVFIPNPNGFFPPITRESLPHTSLNPAVRVFRHAIAVDERRRMFRVDHWKPNQEFKPNVNSSGEQQHQDARERWFAGCHSDVGGGYERFKSGLSQYSLKWMIDEARQTELLIPVRMANYVTGVKRWSSTTEYLYPKASVKAPLHNSLGFAWWPLEIFPKLLTKREWPKRKSFLRLYIPWGEPRRIKADDTIDESVQERIDADDTYRPVNIPKLSPQNKPASE